jgi:hypothetical protein
MKSKEVLIHFFARNVKNGLLFLSAFTGVENIYCPFCKKEVIIGE